MNLRSKINYLFAAVILLTLSCETPKEKSVVKVKAKKPNVIFIMADDLGYGDLGCYGQQQIETPVIDKLARDGMLFTSYYVGSPVCGPSRCSLLSGMHAGRMAVRGNANEPVRRRYGFDRPEVWQDIPMPDSVITMAEIFKNAGYATAAIGKWGLGEMGSEGDPRNQGFDYFYGYYNHIHAHNHFPEYLWENDEKIMLGNDVVYSTSGYALEKGSVSTNKKVYSQDKLIEKSIEFIGKNMENPFFLYLPVIIPHVNNEYKLTGETHGMEVPTLGKYENKEWPIEERSFASMITYMDEGIGKLLAYLKEKGLEEETIVVFTSDNGPHAESHNPEYFDSNSSWRGIKRDVFEGGIRVPFIIKWPEAIRPGTIANQAVAAWDVMATFGEVISVSTPEDSDGKSFYPILSGFSTNEKPRLLYWELVGHRKNIAVAKGDWKLVSLADLETNDWESKLYNLAIDPTESKDLSGVYPEIKKELQLAAKQLRTENELFPIN